MQTVRAFNDFKNTTLATLETVFTVRNAIFVQSTVCRYNNENVTKTIQYVTLL